MATVIVAHDVGTDECVVYVRDPDSGVEVEAARIRFGKHERYHVTPERAEALLRGASDADSEATQMYPDSDSTSEE